MEKKMPRPPEKDSDKKIIGIGITFVFIKETDRHAIIQGYHFHHRNRDFSRQIIDVAKDGSIS
jgi:hypothetical protein